MSKRAVLKRALLVNLDVIRLCGELEKRRSLLGLSWRQVAKAAGVAPSTITRMHAGKHPSATGLLRLTAWLGMYADCFVSIDYGRPT